MKKLTLCFLIVFSIVEVHSQTDYEIANLLIGRNISEIDTVLTNLDLEYYKTLKDKTSIEFYLVKNNSVRLWKVDYHNIFARSKVNGKLEQTPLAKDVITEIFIRYRHSNLNDLKEFFAYEIPEKSKYYLYEKNHGAKLSHLKVVHAGYDALLD
ncbi:MAG: hypothetical protein ISR56_03195 [Bacteroidales bacterium]|nr:hypothetical protein [Bacteroidales bacterium]